MDDLWTRIAQDLTDRVSGPMKLRLLLQPATASLFAVLSGRKDAREGKPAYSAGRRWRARTAAL